MIPEELLYGILGLMALFIPGFVARIRKHHNTNSIFILSIVGIGAAFFSFAVGAAVWLGSLIWAFTNPPAKKD